MSNKKLIFNFQAEVGKLLSGAPNNAPLYLTENIKWHLPDSLHKYIGNAHPQGINEVLDLFNISTKKCYKTATMKFQFHSIICESNYAHQHFTLNAETINGKLYNSGYQTLFRIENNKIAEVWEYFDSGLLLSLVSD